MTEIRLTKDLQDAINYTKDLSQKVKDKEIIINKNVLNKLIEVLDLIADKFSNIEPDDYIKLKGDKGDPYEMTPEQFMALSEMVKNDVLRELGKDKEK